MFCVCVRVYVRVGVCVCRRERVTGSEKASQGAKWFGLMKECWSLSARQFRQSHKSYFKLNVVLALLCE